MKMKHVLLVCLASLMGLACTPRDVALTNAGRARVAAAGKVVTPAAAGSVLDDEADFLEGCTSMNWKEIEIPEEYNCHLANSRTKAFAFVSDRQCFKIGSTAKIQVRAKQLVGEDGKPVVDAAGKPVMGPPGAVRGTFKISRMEIHSRSQLSQTLAKDTGYETLEELEENMLSKQVDKYNKGLITFIYFKDLKLETAVKEACLSQAETGTTEGGSNE